MQAIHEDLLSEAHSLYLKKVMQNYSNLLWRTVSNYVLSNGSTSVFIDEISEPDSSLPSIQLISVFDFRGDHWEKSYSHESNIFKRDIAASDTTRNGIDIQISHLQKALAEKEREIEIEKSLEKVRTRTNAMRKSTELLDVINIISQQLTELGFIFDNVTFGINNQDEGFRFWMAAVGQPTPLYIHVPYKSNPAPDRVIEAQKNGIKFFTDFLNSEENRDWVQHLIDHSDLVHYPEKVKHYILNSPGYVRATFILDNINLYVGNYKAIHYSEVDIKVFERFSRVFDQSYTRFLDLKNAESQAREAQIESSLERVRTNTMAMHNSIDVGTTVSVMFDELLRLGVETIRCGIGIMHEGNILELWTARPNEHGTSDLAVGTMNTDLHPLLQGAYRSWNEKNETYSYILAGEDLVDYFNAVNNYPGYPIRYDISRLPQTIYHNEFYFNEGILFAFSATELNDEMKHIFKRFAGVFGQTYRRYLDLQKAEAQAAEAKIEASLERVRAAAMAMHKTEDMTAAVAVVFEELDKLQLGLIRCGIGIIDGGTKSVEVYTTTKSENGIAVHVTGNESMAIHPLLLGAFHAWQRHEDFGYELGANDLVDYYNATAQTNFQLPDSAVKNPGTPEAGQYYFMAAFQAGGLYAFSQAKFTEASKTVLKKFAGVFTLTYSRFLDLQKAEALAREAQIEAGLERVRSRTLAMQRSDELPETAAVLFRQLINLGIAPTRLYIGIITDETGHIEFWITDEDGSRVSTMFAGEATKNASLMKIFEGWRRQKCQIIDMRGDELAEYFHYLGDELHVSFRDILSQKRRIQYLAYFSKGFIGLASSEEQPESTLKLLERFAYVFNLTFTRFNDLKVAEAHAIQAAEDLIKLQTEKRRAEDALIELRAAQKQLIQSEKMASLGELTAGIAHEIQNPLNFVNNFSEVNKEMLAELREEIDKGDLATARMIADDLIANEEKINHHGKRADAIVKGMLEHSRSGASEKQPTDINALTDEYTRLCYHGLRAKDKSFNCQIKTEYDDSIGNIEIIPKDIGRVILNIVSNAFHAVSEKKKRSLDQFEPIVTIGTKKTVGGVRISIKDNGNGIAEKNLDKIFQPFFTTKPTGQGTGLGLSLSYDIIKAHGGEIKVDSRPGEGVEFVILIPHHPAPDSQ